MAVTRIEGGLIITMDENRSVVEEGTLILQEDRIAEIGKSGSGRSREKDEIVVDARGKILLPGLINAHMHQRPMRGVGDSYNLRIWHDVFVDEVSNLMTPDDAYSGALAGFAEALKGGITTVMAGAIHPQPERSAAEDSGIRARFFAHVIHEEETERYFDRVRSQGGSEADRVRFWVGLEVASISSSRTRRRARELANTMGLRIHTHFSEDKRFDLQALIDDGFLGPDLHMAHCIQVTPEDIDLLARYGVGVAHCPTSNLKLGNGIAPIPAMRAKGIAVGISTDGLISTGRLDLFEQMRVAGLMQRGYHRDPGLCPPEDLLAMVTSEAARTMGMEKELGSLEVGKKADVVMLDSDRIWLTPLVHTQKISNVMQLIVWSATPTDVHTVWVDGKKVVEQGKLKTRDEKEIRSRVQQTGTRILGEAVFKIPGDPSKGREE